MSAFKIGGFSFRPTHGVSNVKKADSKAIERSEELSRSKADSMELRPNRLAVMPRMSTISGQTTQHLQSGTVESLLKDSAAELDDYFSKAYGFGKETD